MIQQEIYRLGRCRLASAETLLDPCEKGIIDSLNMDLIYMM